MRTTPMRRLRMTTPMLEAELAEVPEASLSPEQAGMQLASWLEQRQRVLALTGAGLSTDSGIPDYRGVNGAYRKGHRPMSHDEFASDPAQRRRYWSRAIQGYDKFAGAEPNKAHRGLAALQVLGKVGTIVTQNVDSLHQQCGDDVVPLHGRGDQVVCLNCGDLTDRSAYHDRLKAANPTFALTTDDIRPDGDAEVDVDDTDFEVLPCDKCGGVLKPDVVFFGDNVPKARVDACFEALNDADGLLVCGSSLAVYSSFRFVLAAHRDGKPICILNRGPTRADLESIPLFKLDAPVDALFDAAQVLLDAD